MFDSLEDLSAKLAATGYFIGPVMTKVIFLAARLQKPLLLEGPAGSGNDEIGSIGIDTHFDGHAEGETRSIPHEVQPRDTSGKRSIGSSSDANPIHYATRLDPRGSEGIDRKKLLLLGGGLGVALARARENLPRAEARFGFGA